MLFFSFTNSILDQNGRKHTNKPSDRKGILIWKQCGEEIDDKRIVTMWKKYVFALCLNGIYVRMTLTGITIYVLKNHWHFIKFCLFYVCTDMLDLPFWVEFTGGCKMLKWWFIANHWQAVISLWDVAGGWSNNCYCRLFPSIWFFLEFFNLLFDLKVCMVGLLWNLLFIIDADWINGKSFQGEIQESSTGFQNLNPFERFRNDAGNCMVLKDAKKRICKVFKENNKSKVRN